MIEDIHGTIKEIKRELRLSMNGVTSTLQRRQGLDYKINFGVEIPRLKAIAEKYTQDKELALALWKDNIRECKILAIYLLPEEEYRNVAEEWIADTRYTEIADRLAMHILNRIDCAATKALSWIHIEEGLFKYCGYMTLSHLFRNGSTLNNEEEQLLFSNIADLIESEERLSLKKCAFNTLQHYIEADAEREGRLKATLHDKRKTGLLELL